MAEPIIDIQSLTIQAKSNERTVNIVDNVSLSIEREKVTAIVGGSGSGKTTTGLAILKLISFGLNIESGKILFEGKDLLKLEEEEIRKIRGRDLAMVFQEPLIAFNPVFTIAQQIDEVLNQHLDLSKKARKARVLDLLDMVGISEPARVSQSFPHQLSGGMRQRAMIAQAIATNPKVIIADEPTSNLDVTLQARIIELFARLQDELKLTLILISHDLGMVSHVSDKIAVMSQGRLVEEGGSKDILKSAKHPYTLKLMEGL